MQPIRRLVLPPVPPALTTPVDPFPYSGIHDVQCAIQSHWPSRPGPENPRYHPQTWIFACPMYVSMSLCVPCVPIYHLTLLARPCVLVFLISSCFCVLLVPICAYVYVSTSSSSHDIRIFPLRMSSVRHPSPPGLPCFQRPAYGHPGRSRSFQAATNPLACPGEERRPDGEGLRTPLAGHTRACTYQLHTF